MYRPRDERKAQHSIRWNCLVLLVTPMGVPLVSKPHYRHGASYCGLPGGGDFPFENTALQTALREFLEETGYDLREIDPTGEMLLRLAYSTRKHSYDWSETGAMHDYNLLVGKTEVLPRKRPTITGEVTHFKPAQEFPTADYFLPPHREFLARPEVIAGIRRAIAA